MKKPLSKWTLTFYSLTESSMFMGYIPMAIFIPALYATEFGLSLTSIGMIIMLARFTDVISDPLIGYFSDNTRTIFGRRKPWILFGTPVMLLSIYFLFVPSDAAEIDNFYFAFWVILLWLGWTLINIPFYAWGAELSSSYHERTRVSTWRTLFGVGGTLTTILLPIIGMQFFGFGGPIREALQIIAVTVLVTMPIFVGFLLWQVPEGPLLAKDRIPFFTGLRIMWQNGPFKRLMLGFMIGGVGPAMAGPLYVLFVNHVIGEKLAGNIILLVFYSANLLGVALWGWLARRIGKRKAWLCGMSLMIISQPWYFVLGAGDLIGMMMILFVGGLGAGSFGAIPAAMKADVVDIDRVKSGDDRTGLFFSVWSLANKFIVAIAVGLGFIILDAFGFKADQVNGAEQLMTLKVLFAAFPVACYAVAMAIVWHYPITEAHHAEIIRELEQRLPGRAPA